MNLVSPQQYQALDNYLESVAMYARHLSVFDQYKRTPLADFASWQEANVATAKRLMEAEEAKLKAACGEADFRELFPENLIGNLLANKLSRTAG